MDTIFSKLNEFVSQDLSVYYSGLHSKEQIASLFSDFSKSLEILLDPSRSTDLNETVTTVFLTETLPVLVELLIRKRPAK
jgi:hypothetical protein